MQDLCVYCYGRPQQIDHIKPISIGGKNGWINSAPICNRCNTMKGTMSLVQFLIYIHWYNQYRLTLDRKKARKLALEKLNGN